MIKKYLLALFFFSFLVNTFSQTIPQTRITDWSGAGAKINIYDTTVNIIDFGADSTGVADNTFALFNAMAAMPNGGTVYFPSGTYFFNATQNILSNIRIKGAGAGNTIFNFDKGGIGDCFNVAGSKNNAKDTVVSGYLKDSTVLTVNDASIYQPGQYIIIVENDNGRITSSWASNTIGQVVMIKGTDTALNKIVINQPLRQTYSASLYPRIFKITPKTNVSFECFTINRIDTTTSQTNSFNFSYAAHCMVHGIESYYSNFAHVRIQFSTNVTVGESFFKYGHGYGGGGRAYGVVMQYTAGYNLIENNQFEHLRHSILLQASANGNVIAYNYSLDPFWTGVVLPSNSAGDLVLHGNYVYMNLFEGNIAQNIVIDNSHGINGPYNTFFRNRAELYGIFMNNSPASDSQNFVANDIINTTTGFYALAGTNHFEYGNRHHGNITPVGTDSVPEKSYYLTEAPTFWNHYTNWPSIGVSKPYNSGTIPAKKLYEDSILTQCFDDTLYYDFMLCNGDSLPLNGKFYSSIGNYIDSIQAYRGIKRYLSIQISGIPKPQITTYSSYLMADSGVAYQWYFGNTKLNGDTLRRLDYTQNGYYKVLVTGINGCSQFTDSVLVSNASMLSIKNEYFKIYPNPALNYFVVEQTNKKGSLKLFDGQGKLLMDKSLNSKMETISINELTPGVYFMSLQADKEVYNTRLMVR